MSNPSSFARQAPPLPIFSSSENAPSSITVAGSSEAMSSKNSGVKKSTSPTDVKALAKKAQMENDAMVYLDGPQVYTCGQCRTHLTSHDDIISKSFHGRHGRAYLFDQCVNVNVGPAEDRYLITGLHSVCDIFCKRCKEMVGWTYAKAYEQSQKYKEGKFIIEKINLHLEESDYYDVVHPAGERGDKWRVRSMSWGSERSLGTSPSSSYLRNSGRDFGAGGAGGLIGSTPLSPRSSSSSYSYTSSYQHHRSPRTPRRSHNQISGIPPSPRSPSDIVYEYRNERNNS